MYALNLRQGAHYSPHCCLLIPPPPLLNNVGGRGWHAPGRQGECLPAPNDTSTQTNDLLRRATREDSSMATRNLRHRATLAYREHSRRTHAFGHSNINYRCRWRSSDVHGTCTAAPLLVSVSTLNETQQFHYSPALLTFKAAAVFMNHGRIGRIVPQHKCRDIFKSSNNAAVVYAIYISICHHGAYASHTRARRTETVKPLTPIPAASFFLEPLFSISEGVTLGATMVRYRHLDRKPY